MAVPGLTGGAHGLTYAIQASATDVDLFAALGSPSASVSYKLIIPASIVVSATASTVPALAATGFHASTTGIWVVTGDIPAAGGLGGDGWEWSFSSGYFKGGGGGGGAGNIVGLGGSGAGTGPAATDGDDGLLTTGGNGGASINGDGDFDIAGTLGADGGDAVTLDHVVTIYLTGAIAGGGGGGDGGDTPDAGGDGGGRGSPGSPGGAAGYAIRYSGAGSATIVTIGSGATYGTVG